MNARTRPPIGLSASTHAFTAAALHGAPRRPFSIGSQNIFGSCFNTPSIASRFGPSGTASPSGTG
eukprot:26089-Pelagococcus_subviridis.AAC.1